MYVDRRVKVPGILGYTEASTTRRPETPRTRKLESSTAMGSPSAPMAHVHEQWWPQAVFLMYAAISSGVWTEAPGRTSVRGTVWLPKAQRAMWIDSVMVSMSAA
jgi:hypothetical protein